MYLCEVWTNLPAVRPWSSLSGPPVGRLPVLGVPHWMTPCLPQVLSHVPPDGCETPQRSTGESLWSESESCDHSPCPPEQSILQNNTPAESKFSAPIWPANILAKHLLILTKLTSSWLKVSAANTKPTVLHDSETPSILLNVLQVHLKPYPSISFSPFQIDVIYEAFSTKILY